MKKLLHAFAAFSLAFIAAGAQAQAYPSQPIRLVVPYPAGGAVDFLGRQLAAKLGAELKQTVVVENRAGAGGLIGADHVAKAKPDGYTIVLGTNSSHSIAPSVVKKMPYDPVNDFAPVSLVAVTPYVVVVNPEVPAKTLAELIALAKSRPDSLTFGSAGAGTTPRNGNRNCQNQRAQWRSRQVPDGEVHRRQKPPPPVQHIHREPAARHECNIEEHQHVQEPQVHHREQKYRVRWNERMEQCLALAFRHRHQQPRRQRNDQEATRQKRKQDAPGPVCRKGGYAAALNHEPRKKTCHQEKHRHPEHVDEQEKCIECLAGRVVNDRPVDQRHGRKEGHHAVQHDPQQQRDGANGIQRMEPFPAARCRALYSALYRAVCLAGPRTIVEIGRIPAWRRLHQVQPARRGVGVSLPSVNENVAPSPGAARAQMRPPCRAMMRCVMARLMPMPEKSLGE